MKLQRVGGVASMANAFLTAIFLIILTALFPHLGLVKPADWIDPVKGIPAWAASPITFSLFNIDYVLMSIALLLTILALRERMQSGAPTLMRIAVIATSIGCALWAASGLIEIAARASIVSTKDASAYRALMGVVLGLSITGDHALGWALFSTGWAALRTANLSRILSYLAALAGVLLILDFCSMALGFGGYVLFVIWSFWLGVVLLRSKT
jgi:hypothetical protein